MHAKVNLNDSALVEVGKALSDYLDVYVSFLMNGADGRAQSA